MLGVTQIATNNSSTRNELERAGRQLENAAYALGEIENDLTNAGFWGELGSQDPGIFPPVCPDEINATPADDEFRQVLAYPVQGGQGEFDCVTVDPPGTKIAPKAGTDYLAIRRVNSCALGDLGCDAVGGGHFYLQVHACFDPTNETDLPGISYVIDSIDDVPDLSIFRYTQRGADCGAAPPAPQYRFLNRVYYLNDDDQLVRAELVGNQYTQTTLVEGVEMLRIEYGLDSTGNDGQVDEYTNNPNVPDPTAWGNVVMARVSLVVRSTESSGGFVDNKVYTVAGASYTVPAEFRSHRRQVYTRTVSLRNVAGRREQ